MCVVDPAVLGVGAAVASLVQAVRAFRQRRGNSVDVGAGQKLGRWQQHLGQHLSVLFARTL